MLYFKKINIGNSNGCSKSATQKTPGKSIIAYHFGLFETAHGYTVYLIGSKEYDRNDPDWTLNNDFEPHHKYYPITAGFDDGDLIKIK